MNAAVARVLAVVTLAAGAAVLTGPAAAAVPGGLLLALVLPGLAVTATLFRGRALSAVERTVLAPALSLAVLVVAGLLIYLSGYALNRPAWTGATVGVTLLGLIVPAVPLPRRTAERTAAVAARENEIRELAAAARLAVQGATRPAGEATVRLLPGGSAADATQPLPPLPPVRPAGRPPLKRIARQLVPMILVLAVLGGAGWLSYVSSHRSYEVRVTALSAAPPGTPDDTGDRAVRVSATGLLAADGPYRIAVLTADGAQTQSRTVPVTGSGGWTGTVTVGRGRTTIALYRSGDRTAFRTLYVAAAE